MVCAGGRHVVWCFAPGYSNGRANSISNMEMATAFKFREAPTAKTMTITAGEARYGLDNSSPASRLSRVFLPEDGETVGLMGGKPALVS